MIQSKGKKIYKNIKGKLYINATVMRVHTLKTLIFTCIYAFEKNYINIKEEGAAGKWGKGDK